MNATMIINPKSGKVIINISDYDLTKAVKKDLEKRFLVKSHNGSKQYLSMKKV